MKLLQALISVLAALSSLLVSLPAASDALAWQLTRGETRLTLVGSVHAGRSDFYPLSPAIEQAFERASSLWVEFDITQLDSDLYQQLVLQRGLLSDEEAANFHDTPVWGQFQDLCAKEGFCQPDHSLMRPWLLSLQLARQMLAGSPYRAAWGVDVYFLQRRGQRKVLELESLPQQIQAFAGLAMPAQQQLLLASVQDYERGSEPLEALFSAWTAGDATTIFALVLEPMRKNSAVYQALFADRNQLMAEKLDQAAGVVGEQFVVVGAGHLLGEHSLVRLLAARGFSVVQISGDACVEPAC